MTAIEVARLFIARARDLWQTLRFKWQATWRRAAAFQIFSWILKREPIRGCTSSVLIAYDKSNCSIFDEKIIFSRCTLLESRKRVSLDTTSPPRREDLFLTCSTKWELQEAKIIISHLSLRMNETKDAKLLTTTCHGGYRRGIKRSEVGV